MEITPLDDLKRAAEGGLKLYWLGETFEGMALQDVRLQEGELTPQLRYGQGDPSMEPDWVIIEQYTPESWAERGNHRCQGWRSGAVETEVVLSGVEATLCEVAWPAPPPPQPEGGAPEEPARTAPDDDCVNRDLVIHFPDAVVIVNSSSGPCGTNPYRSREQLLRLGASLRPFEAPVP